MFLSISHQIKIKCSALWTFKLFVSQSSMTVTSDVNKMWLRPFGNQKNMLPGSLWCRPSHKLIILCFTRVLRGCLHTLLIGYRCALQMLHTCPMRLVHSEVHFITLPSYHVGVRMCFFFSVPPSCLHLKCDIYALEEMKNRLLVLLPWVQKSFPEESSEFRGWQ